MKKKAFLVILILALCAIPLAAQAASYEEFTPGAPQAQPAEKPVVAITSPESAVSYSGIRVYVLGNSEQAVVACRKAFQLRGATIVFAKDKADIVVNITESDSSNYETSWNRNDYGNTWNGNIQIKTGNGYRNTFNLPVAINHERNEQKFVAHVNLTAEAVDVTTSELVASAEASATTDKKYGGSSDGVAGIFQSRNQSNGGDDCEALTSEALRQASEQLADQLVGQLKTNTPRLGGGTVELIFDYKNYPKIGDRVEILQNGVVVGEAKIMELIDDGWQWRAMCQMLSGTKPSNCNWRIKR